MTKGWETTSFSDVCSIDSALVDPREAEYSDLLHVGGANIESSNGVLIDLKTAKDEGLKSGKFLFDDSTVLYSKIRPYLMKVARPEFRGLCSADIYPLTPKPGVLERDYLYHVLLSPEFTDFAVAGSARAGMPKVNRDHLFSYGFLLPPLAEQQRIVGILDEAFEGIATVKANAEKNLQNARALFETIGVVRLIETDVEFSIFVSVALIKPVLRELGPYLVYALRASCVQSQIVPQGAALKHLYLVDLRRLGIPLPPLSEQNRIVARLDSLAEETQRLATIYERKLAALDDLKKSLLHRAFSGQWIMEN